MSKKYSVTPFNKSFVVKKTKKGMGVFANKSFLKGEFIINFLGNIFTLEELPKPYDEVNDHYVQIGPKLYMGPSGKTDDLINHSCNPNTGIVIVNSKSIFLIAIKRIDAGEEITWDYSTTMDENDWELDCCCGSKTCRKKVRDFKYLPEKTKKRYLKLRIVPKYIRLKSKNPEVT